MCVIICYNKKPAPFIHVMIYIASLTAEFQTGSNISTRTVHQELHEMDFHGRAAVHKLLMTMHNAKRQLEETGRASCRERVLSLVAISGRAVS